MHGGAGIGLTRVPGISERIAEATAHRLELRWLWVDVPDVVTLHVSWSAPLATTAREELLFQIAIGLLDRGAADWTEEAMATYLEDRGVELRFNLDSGRVRCEARMLKRHVPDVLPLIDACMNAPLMEEASFVTVVSRLRSNLMQARSRTAARASTGLRRHIFAPGHPGYAWEVDERLAALSDISASDVASCYHEQMRPIQIHAVLVGDVGDEQVLQITKGVQTGDMGTRVSPPVQKVPPLQAVDPVQIHVPLADRSNLDVRMGHGVSLCRTHEDHDALKTGIHALGGNFSSRLMSTVRDRDGLTYGIGSSLSDVDVCWPGMWGTSLSLSAPALEKGVQCALAEIRTFIRDGITADERDAVVGTLTGSARVQLGTTSGLAAVMLRHMERGEPAKEIDAWSERIQRLTTQQINDALATWLDADRLHIVSAGTVQ